MSSFCADSLALTVDAAKVWCVHGRSWALQGQTIDHKGEGFVCARYVWGQMFSNARYAE